MHLGLRTSLLIGDIQVCVLPYILMSSLFEKKDYELEKKVVKEESVRDNDDPECIIENMSDKIIYNGSSYEMPIDDQLCPIISLPVYVHVLRITH